MEKNKNAINLCLLTMLGCLFMVWVEIGLLPGYGIKSLIKLGLFLGIVSIFVFLTKENPFCTLFILEKKKLANALLLGVLVYILIVGAYLLFGRYFDFSQVTVSLENNLHIRKETFFWVALYIAVVNSLLEEFFFRGFAFLTLKKYVKRKVAYGFSGGMFALYHVSMMIGWFSAFFLALLILGLFIGGLLFDWLDEKSGAIYPSWMVHLWANLGINTVGMLLFYGR